MSELEFMKKTKEAFQLVKQDIINLKNELEHLKHIPNSSPDIEHFQEYKKELKEKILTLDNLIEEESKNREKEKKGNQQIFKRFKKELNIIEAGFDKKQEIHTKNIQDIIQSIESDIVTLDSNFKKINSMLLSQKNEIDTLTKQHKKTADLQEELKNNIEEIQHLKENYESSIKTINLHSSQIKEIKQKIVKNNKDVDEKIEALQEEQSRNNEIKHTEIENIDKDTHTLYKKIEEKKVEKKEKKEEKNNSKIESTTKNQQPIKKTTPTNKEVTSKEPLHKAKKFLFDLFFEEVEIEEKDKNKNVKENKKEESKI